MGTTTRRDYEDIHDVMWGQIASLLTGLTLEQLESLGGYRVIDIRTGRVLFDLGQSDAA